MKLGMKIPRDRRDGMARKAFEIFNICESAEEAHRTIGKLFDVSRPTAINLLGRGRYLSTNRTLR